ncbi:hypothetical protein ACLOJK_012053 [Asimina triloba]
MDVGKCEGEGKFPKRSNRGAEREVDSWRRRIVLPSLVNRDRRRPNNHWGDESQVKHKTTVYDKLINATGTSSDAALRYLPLALFIRPRANTEGDKRKMAEVRNIEEGWGEKPPPAFPEEEEHKKKDGGAIPDDGGKEVAPTEQQQVNEGEEQLQTKVKSKRVATLDAFRGLTIVVLLSSSTLPFVIWHKYCRWLMMDQPHKLHQPEIGTSMLMGAIEFCAVDDAGGAYEKIDHSPWNGCTLADFVLPFFLFIAGVAIALAFKEPRQKAQAEGPIGGVTRGGLEIPPAIGSGETRGAILRRVPDTGKAVRRIIIRTVKLLFWGILLQGGYSHAPDNLSYGADMKHIRWCGILQVAKFLFRFCSFVIATLIEVLTVKVRPTVLTSGHFSIFSAYHWQWLGGFVALLIYMATVYGLYVPDWSFVLHNEHGDERLTVTCGTRGHLGPACNAVGYVDRQVWGVNHLYSSPVWTRLKVCRGEGGHIRKDAPAWCSGPFEPEGLLRYFRIFSPGHSERLKQWVLMGLGTLIVAIILHFTDAIPLNKQLYSFSYVLFTAGAAGLVFSAFYMLIDVWGIRMPFLFLEWIGMNAMLVFVMAAQGIFDAFINGWYYENEGNTLVYWIQKHIFFNVWHSERLGTLLYVIFAEITFWGVVAGILHKLGIYWKL